MTKPHKGWDIFWDRSRDSESIRLEAHDYLERALPHIAPTGDELVLDFGCGFGHVAKALAPYVARVDLWDASGPVLEKAVTLASDTPNVSRAERFGSGFRAKYNLIVVNSVIQYVSSNELKEVILLWASALRSEGRILLSDVPMASPSLVVETWQWLRFRLPKGRLGEAFGFALKNLVGYVATRSKTPLTHLDEQEMAKIAGTAQLKARMLPANLTFRTHRSSYMLEREGDTTSISQSNLS